MRELSERYQQHAASQPNPAPADVAALINKLESFVHAPTRRAAAERVVAYASPAAVETVTQVLPAYRPWTLPWYDIIGYWYSVALLALVRSPAAGQALATLTQEALAVGWADLSLLRRTYAFFPAVPELAALRQAVEQHFQQLSPQVEALTWAQHVGLQVPATPDWRLVFELSTDGEKKFPFQLSAAEKQQRLTLSVDVFAAADGDGRSWEMHVYNADNSTHGQFTRAADRFLVVQYRLLSLPVAPSLLGFSAFVAAVEAATGAQFVRKVAYSYFSKGIKNKAAVSQWLAAG